MPALEAIAWVVGTTCFCVAVVALGTAVGNALWPPDRRTARSLDAMVRELAAQRGMQRAMPPTVPMQMDPRRPR